MPMSIDGVIRENKVKVMVHPFFVKFKKHYCNMCGERLKISWITQIIHRNSPEAEGKDLAFGPEQLFKKPIKYTFAIFECPYCEHKLSIYDQYVIEKPYATRPTYDDYHQYLKAQNLGRGDGSLGRGDGSCVL